jgi:hypothetical protein
MTQIRMLHMTRLLFGRVVALTMAIVLLITSLPLGVAQAALVTTDQVLGDQAQNDARRERDKVSAFLQREEVRRQMIALGVNPMEAVARVASLSDAEIRRVAGHIDSLPAGQGVIVALIGAAVFIFLVLLITDLLGLTHVFPFVRDRT